MSKKRLYLFVTMTILFIGLTVFGLIAQHRHNAERDRQLNALKGGSSYDSNSGDTVSDPSGKGPDTYGAVNGEPTFLGLSGLLNYGVSQTQVAATKQAFTAYATSFGAKIVSINQSNIQTLPMTDGVSSITFKVVIDKKTNLKATLSYWQLTEVRLVLNDSTSGAQIFDSGTVDTVPSE